VHVGHWRLHSDSARDLAQAVEGMVFSVMITVAMGPPNQNACREPSAR